MTRILFLLMSFFMLLHVHAGSINGYKFNDLNGDGVDNNEPRLPGFLIVLESKTDPDLDMERITNLDGYFSFLNLPVGKYRVCEVAPEATPPWIPTTPDCVRVTLRGKTSKMHIRFGNRQEGGTSGGTTGGGTTGGTTGGTSGGTSGGTTGGSEGCTRTQGYWGSAPAGEAQVPVLVPGTMTLGTVNYSAAQLATIFDTTPAGGNALQSLAHQLIAANLNILAGASAPVAVTNAINAANTLIGSLVIMPVGSGFVHNSTTLGGQMDTQKTILDNYNNGLLGVPHCD